MDIKNIEEFWYSGRILPQAFQEYKLCLCDVYERAERILQTPSSTPYEFIVKMQEIPNEFYSLKKNIFSTLFQSMYHLLGVERERRMLYGKLNHLFRTWVTSADNLLDGEDKVVIPIQIPGSSRVMRQVISIMVADRIMKQLLEDTQVKGIISCKESQILSDMSLQILLPSAAEEASEEEGIVERPHPDYVLYTIHRLKTGLLFHIPFLGPQTIERHIDSQMLARCKDALGKFGLGCQLLDDIRDMAKDYLENRHNYILSKIYQEEKISSLARLKELESGIDLSSKIYSYFPEEVHLTAELAKDLLNEGLRILNKSGLGICNLLIKRMVFSMFKILDIADVTKCLSIN